MSQVRDVDWDADLGANSFDMLLADHMTRQFAEKHKLKLDSIFSNPKSMAKMKKQVGGVNLIAIQMFGNCTSQCDPAMFNTCSNDV